MASRFVLPVLILLAGLVAFFVLRPAEEDAKSVPPGADDVAVEPPTDDPEEELTVPAAPEDDEPARSVATEDDEEEPAPPREGPGLRVRVVDPTGKPQGGIPVALFVTVPQMPVLYPAHQAETAPNDGIAWLELDISEDRLPPNFESAVGIDLPLEPRVLHGFGHALPKPSTGDEVVELVLPEGAESWLAPLRVQVVDVEENPVFGARVEFHAVPRSSPSDRDDLGSALTEAPEGIASISREEQRQMMTTAKLLGLSLDFEVTCEGPYVPLPTAAIPLEPSSEPMRLVLPPTATVVVHLHHTDGIPVARDATASLEWYPAGEEMRGGWWSADVEEGTARFERVGLGLDLRMSGSLADLSVESAWQSLPGPKQEGETLDVELVLGPPYPLLVGRLLDADGAPVADQRFSFAADLYDPPPRHPAAGPRRLRYSYHSTDGEGRVRFPYSDDVTTPGRFLRIVEQSPRRGAPPGWVARFAQVDFPALTLDGSRLEVGDLVLRDVPILVAGRAVDESGAPVKGATLQCRYAVGEGDERAWHNVNFTNGSRRQTNAEGWFEVRSLQEATQLEVSAYRRGVGGSERILVPPYSTDVLLAVLPEEDYEKTRGKVEGWMLLDEDIPTLLLTAELHGERGKRDSYVFGGAFEFRHVLPGRHRFEVRTDRTDFLLETIEGVVVHAGETTHDPRLEGIDLRGRLRLLRLRLVTTEGHPVYKEYVHVGVRRGEEGRIRTDEEGRLTVLMRVEDPTVRVGLRGHVPVDVAWTVDEQRIVLVEE